MPLCVGLFGLSATGLVAVLAHLGACLACYCLELAGLISNCVAVFVRVWTGLGLGWLGLGWLGFFVLGSAWVGVTWLGSA